MDLWIVGAGGVGRETVDVALAVGADVSGFLDDGPTSGLVQGLVVRPIDDLEAGSAFLVAIGAPGARLAVAGRVAALGGRPVSLVHPTSVIGSGTTVGPGALVMGLAHVSCSVALGPHTQIHYGATVGHDTVLDEGATVLPGANVAGTVHIGRAATVGSGAIVLQGRSIGAGALVGAGAVVTHDVPPGVVVVGSPARPLER